MNDSASDTPEQDTPPRVRQERVWQAGLVIIGNEILSGRTQDANLAYLAKWLNQQGIRLAHVRVVPDQTSEIVEAVNALRARYDYLFTTGGIGPTHDDITVDAIAAAFGVPVIMHPKAQALLEAYYGARITPTRLRMARVPQGAELIENAMTGAPGVRMDNVYILAGIPRVMQGMLAALEGQLEGGQRVLSKTVGAYVAESKVAELLAQIESAHDVLVGSYPFWTDGRVGANFVVSSPHQAQVHQAITALLAGLAALGVQAFDHEVR
jgi:molybdenum cofactor synthesis domain-containing protein